MEERNLYKELIDNSFAVTINANDFFAFATAMSVEIDKADLKWVMQVMRKYPKDGLDACISFIMQKPPIKTRQTEEFKEAVEFIKSLDIIKVWSRDYNG